ncbi:MAG: fatty acid desaturase family protein [Flavobacteriales bacterium]
MSSPVVKFNLKDNPEFFKVLRKRVSQYFKDNNIDQHANLKMKIKTTFMICLYFVPWIVLLANVVTGFLPNFALWLLMGLGMSGIGLSIMHDANHGCYSRNKKVNNMLGFLVNFLGAYHVNWKIQHNILHHSFTNVHGYDEDISNPALRFTPDQEIKSLNKFQAFYAPFLYSIMTIYWVFGKDFIQLKRYGKKDLLKTQNLSNKQAWREVIFNKIWYLILFLVIPMLVVELPWWQSVLGFVSMHLLCGLTLALIFQPAHVIEDTEFFVPDENLSVENNWAIHQMKTTSNFANKSTWFSWFIGGLNFQIEHHLFPNICHIHYKGISKIVKETALEYGVPYYEHKTFYSAVKSHFVTLHKLGRGTF